MKFIVISVLVAVVAIIGLDAREINSRVPEVVRQPKLGYSGPSTLDISNADISNADNGADNDDNDILLNYDPFPMHPKSAVVVTAARNPNNNRIKSDSFQSGLERESGLSANQKTIVREVMSSQPSEPKGSLNIDRVKDIASNSREVRLMGPDQKPVEMNDDLPTKFIVAMDNLKKEATDVWGQVNEKLDKGWTEVKRAEVWGQINDKLDKGLTDLKSSEVWGQVNEKLDKGWTDFKSMIEGVVAPKKREN